MTITGQVDQGSSANKQMRLYVGMVGYDDGKVSVDGNDVTITYDTSTMPYLQMSLAGIPSGTLSGSLVGSYTMTGDLQDTVMLDVTMSGTLEAGPSNTVLRAPGTHDRHRNREDGERYLQRDGHAVV